MVPSLSSHRGKVQRMATDDHEIERHLTPNGWVAGNEWVNGKQIKTVDKPADTVETWVETISDSSEGWDPPTTSSRLTSAKARADLKERFPRQESKPWKKLPKKKRRTQS
jgi:hypothetical protein